MSSGCSIVKWCVFFFLPEHDWSHPCSSIKYFILWRWPFSAALWRGWQPCFPGVFGLHFSSVMKNRTMSMWPFIAAMCKGVVPLFVVRECMKSFIGLYFSISSVRNLTMLRPPLLQLMCNGVHPHSSWHSGSTCCSVTRYLITSRWACSAAT